MQLQDCPPIQYTRRRGQKNIRIRVKNNEIIVSAPWHCPERTMIGFVQEREDWIRKTIAKFQHSHIRQKNLLESKNGHLLLRGEWIPIETRHSRPGKKKWQFIERVGRIDAYPPDMWQTTSGIIVPPEEKRRFLTEVARKELPIKFEEIAAQLPFKWSRLFIRSQKTKWGTCSSKGNISLNWRLIMCPPTILEYLVVHELSHTVHMNHSRKFWELVAKHYPDVDFAHKWLKKEGQICFLI